MAVCGIGVLHHAGWRGITRRPGCEAAGPPRRTGRPVQLRATAGARGLEKARAKGTRLTRPNVPSSVERAIRAIRAGRQWDLAIRSGAARWRQHGAPRAGCAVRRHPTCEHRRPMFAHHAQACPFRPNRSRSLPSVPRAVIPSSASTPYPEIWDVGPAGAKMMKTGIRRWAIGTSTRPGASYATTRPQEWRLQNILPVIIARYRSTPGCLER